MANYVSENLDFNYDDEKKKLTPRVVYNRLIAIENTFCSLNWVRILVSWIIAALFMFIFINGDLFTKGWTLFLEIITISIPLFMTVGEIVRHNLVANGIRNGNYIVTTDTVDFVIRDDKYKVKFYRGRVYRYYEHAMYLKRLGRIIINEKQMDIISPDDMLYIVVRKKRLDRPILIYNSKFYEIEELKLKK